MYYNVVFNIFDSNIVIVFITFSVMSFAKTRKKTVNFEYNFDLLEQPLNVE